MAQRPARVPRQARLLPLHTPESGSVCRDLECPRRPWAPSAAAVHRDDERLVPALAWQQPELLSRNIQFHGRAVLPLAPDLWQQLAVSAMASCSRLLLGG